MFEISLAFETDQLAIDNKGIPGYDRSKDILAQGVAMQQEAHKRFRKVLASIHPQQ